MTKKTEQKKNETAEAPLPLTIPVPLNEAVVLHNAIQVACKRGAFEMDELKNVVAAFDALSDEFKKIAPPADPNGASDEAQGEAEGN